MKQFNFFEDYLRTHKIIEIGEMAEGEVCSDIILDSPIEFIMLLDQSEFYISRILWWDYVEINVGSNIGYGGPKDIRNEKFFWAETYIESLFSIDTNSDEILKYIAGIQEKYKNHNLYPSFTVNYR